MLNRLSDGTWLLDHSTIESYQSCRKMFELQHLRNLRPNTLPAAMDMGGAFHAGIEAYRLGGTEQDIVEAVRRRGENLPFASTESKRSIENCVEMVGRYIDHWDSPGHRVYDVMTVPVPEGACWTGEGSTCKVCGCYRAVHTAIGLGVDVQFQCSPRPLVEVVHRVILCEVPRRIVYVGKMDALLIHRSTSDLWVDELKTTSRLSAKFMEQVRPNNQGTGYVKIASETLGRRVAGWILDAALVAEKVASPRRKPEDWFARNASHRSQDELNDWYRDTVTIANEICILVEAWIEGDNVRWIKSAPAACHRYDGCMFLPICRTLEDPGVIASEFHEEQWDLIEMGRKPL